MSSNIIERLVVNEIKEVMNTPVYGSSTFSLLDSNTFYIQHNPGSTIALTNAQLANDGIITVSFIAPAGAMAIPASLTINGSSATIKWAGGKAPTQSTGSIQIITLSIVTLNGSVAHVLGGKSYY